ncbi:MAG TPA: hypothetical protein VLE91_00595 [Candidatus Saccharimonadales bacterium]|nr:hypothetical protein [Candidatus Saccharimonadales bacterium]
MDVGIRIFMIFLGILGLALIVSLLQLLSSVKYAWKIFIVVIAEVTAIAFGLFNLLFLSAACLIGCPRGFSFLAIIAWTHLLLAFLYFVAIIYAPITLWINMKGSKTKIIPKRSQK